MYVMMKMLLLLMEWSARMKGHIPRRFLFTVVMLIDGTCSGGLRDDGLINRHCKWNENVITFGFGWIKDLFMSKRFTHVQFYSL